jgi:ABC-2 type transport system permease protein
MSLYWLARRSALRTLRRPAAFYPSLLFPLVLLAITTGGLHLSERVTGFPAVPYFTFALAGAFVQGALVGGVNAGVDLATDMQTGFLSRISLTPTPPRLVILGQLAGALVLALSQSVLYLVIAVVTGVRLASGFGGAAAVLALTVLMSLAFSSFGAFLALRTRSSEAVLGTFPLTFVLLLFSSFFMPRALMARGWFASVADWNPVSYLIEAVRGLVITGWDAAGLARGFGVAAGLAACAVALTATTLRTRSVLG